MCKIELDSIISYIAAQTIQTQFMMPTLDTLLPGDGGEVGQQAPVLLRPLLGVAALPGGGEGDHGPAPPVPRPRQQRQPALHQPPHVAAARTVTPPGACNIQPVVLMVLMVS